MNTENKELQNLIDSTKVLGSLLSEKMDSLKKLDIIIQLRRNLQLLENDLGSEDLSEELRSIRDEMHAKIKKLSDPTLIESIKNTASQIMATVSGFSTK